MVMQVLKQRYARALLRKTKQPRSPLQGSLWEMSLEPEHVWQRRFYDFVVWSQAKIEEKIRYMHGNPAKRGLVRTPEQWRWSSAREYILGEAGPVRLNERQTVELKWSDPKSKTTPEPVWESEPECPPSEKRGGWGNHDGPCDDKRWASPRNGWRKLHDPLAFIAHQIQRSIRRYWHSVTEAKLNE